MYTTDDCINKNMTLGYDLIRIYQDGSTHRYGTYSSFMLANLQLSDFDDSDSVHIIDRTR